MVQNVNPTFVKTPNLGQTQISTGTSSGIANPNIVYTGGVNGSKINALIATSYQTSAAMDIQWGVSTTSASTFFLVYGTVLVTTAAGSSDSQSAINMMSNSIVPLAVDSDGNPFIFLPSTSYTLVARPSPGNTSSTWQSSAIVNIIVPSAGDF